MDKIVSHPAKPYVTVEGGGIVRFVRKCSDGLEQYEMACGCGLWGIVRNVVKVLKIIIQGHFWSRDLALA